MFKHIIIILKYSNKVDFPEYVCVFSAPGLEYRHVTEALRCLLNTEMPAIDPRVITVNGFPNT